MSTTNIKIGDRVSPANDGEDRSGKALRWTALRGTVKAVYPPIGREEREQGITRVEVRWDCKCPYPRVVPSNWLKRA